jgi:hypothetical protein
MADGLLAGNAAQAVDNVVAGDSARFIDHKKPVHMITLAACSGLANFGGDTRIE